MSERSPPGGPAAAPLRILFAGSPAIALPSLDMIARGALEGRWVLAGVLTNPDSRRGRSAAAEPTETGSAAAALAEPFAAAGLAPPVILKPESLKEEARKAAAALGPELLVSFAYGRIFGPRFLALFPLGGINVHPSLLPKYRGASPIQEAILREDAETGICVQRIAAEMDTGNILASETIPLSGEETAAALGETAALRGAAVLQKVLEHFAAAFSAGEAPPEGLPQRGTASRCGIIGKDAGLIRWEDSAGVIGAQVRAYNPWPLARTAHNGRILHILEARPVEGPTPGDIDSHACPGRVLGTDPQCGILVQTGKGVLGITRLQYRTKKALPWREFLNGARDFTGSRLQGGS